MGIYLNPGAAGFKMSLNSEIFVDKSELLDVTNRYVNTQQRFMCVSRPRRFGKSMAADMLAAYYDCGDDTEELFEGLSISQCKSYRKHLNQYDVLKINMQEFLSLSGTIEEMLRDYLLLDSNFMI